MRETSFKIKSASGRQILVREWKPDSETTPEAVIIISHGYAEHSGRYRYTAEAMTKLNFNVFAPDHVGHGLSEGPRADVPDISIFVKDFLSVLKEAKDRVKNVPVYFLGHSMGGAVAVMAAEKAGPEIRGLILSGSAIRVKSDLPKVLLSAAGMLASVLPGLPLADFGAEGLSRDPAVIKGYREDPLNYNGKVKARMGRELLKAEKIVTEKFLAGIKTPVLVMHGEKDSIIDPECSRIIYNSVDSSDRQLKIFENLYHEILNEPEKDEVLDLITGWIRNRN